ncbi:helix-turn-helix transcriptional regulator [Maricaulis sp.]|uniref:helix-turn-helix transcriptional regulator n=1 Tax=Maricaulis sp. TaxID=1486257 RepID=UPI003A949848
MLLSINDVACTTTLSKSSIRRSVRNGTFPAPVRLLEKRLAWHDHEVEDWILARPPESARHCGAGVPA